MSSVKGLLQGNLVDGTGTAGYVPKWTGANTITTGVIYDNGTNVGIGTSSPTAFANFTTLSINNASQGGIFETQSNGTSALRVACSASDSALWEPRAVPVLFGTNNTERMRIDLSGNVLIKTTTNTNSSGVGATFDAGQSNGRAALRLGTSSTDSNFLISLHNPNGVVGTIGTSGTSMEIKFEGGAAANTLDDYEEGTWTPFYYPQNGSFNALSMSIVTATYTKIGNLVIASAFLRTSNIDTSGSGGIVYLGGLPFISSTQSYSGAVLSRKIDFSTAPTDGFVEAGNNYVNFMINTTPFQTSHLSNGSGSRNQLMISAIYHTS